MAGSALAAQQQSPQPPQEQPAASGTQQIPRPDPDGTFKAPLVVKIQPTPKTDAEAAEEQRQERERASDRERTYYLGIATVFVAFLQSVIIALQLRVSKQQRTFMRGQNDITKTMLETTKEIERAYIAISTGSPGLDFDDLMVSAGDEPPMMRTHISINVKNLGNTPATVTAFSFKSKIGPLAKTPT